VAHLRPNIAVSAGTASITVRTPAPGGGISNAITFTINAPLPPGDTEPPAVDWVRPVGNDEVFNVIDEDILLKTDNYDSVEMSRAEMYWYDSIRHVNVPIYSGPSVNSTNFRATLATSTLNMGMNQVFCTAYDKAGNSTTRSIWLNRTNTRPSPLLTSIDPTSIVAGSAGFWLSVNGSSFSTNSVVRFNGTELSTSFQSTDFMIAWVTPELIQGTIQATIDVSTPSPWGGVSISLAFPVMQSGVCQPHIGLALGGQDTWRNDGPGSTDQIDTYGDTGMDERGPEYAYTFTTSETKKIVPWLINNPANLGVIVLDGASGICNSQNVVAFGGGMAIFTAEAGHPYFIVVEGYQNHAGTYTIQIDTLHPYPRILSANFALSSKNLVLYVNGTGFMPGSKLKIENHILETFYASDSLLIVTIPSTLGLKKGDYAISIVNSAPGGGESNPLQMNLPIDLGDAEIYIPFVRVGPTIDGYVLDTKNRNQPFG
jgi:hypothetical protein